MIYSVAYVMFIYFPAQRTSPEVASGCECAGRQLTIFGDISEARTEQQWKV